jgi:hypothetical protein
MNKGKAEPVLHPYSSHSRKPIMGIDQVITFVFLANKPLKIIGKLGQMATEFPAV